MAASSHCSRVLSSVSQMAARGKGRQQTRFALSCASSALTYGSWHSALVSSLSVSTSEVVGWHEQGFIATLASSLAAGPVRTKHAARAKKTSQVIRPKETLADNRCPLLPRGVGTGGRAGHGNRQPVPCPPPLGKLLPPSKEVLKQETSNRNVSRHPLLTFRTGQKETAFYPRAAHKPSCSGPEHDGKLLELGKRRVRLV